MKIIISKNNDPYYNLSLEEVILKNQKSNEDILLLYINKNAIICGRNQNVWEEVNNDYVQKHKIKIVRRISGGGAVYHDNGNLNFSFITKTNGSYSDFLKPVINFLKTLNLKAEFHGKNDIHVNGYKVSGNAQYKFKDRMFHHGTILFNSNMKMIVGALKPNELKMASKGIKSIRQRVSNLYDLLDNKLSTEQFKNLFVSFFKNNFKAIETNVDKKYSKEINELMTKRKSESWIYGKNPNFNFSNQKRFQGGTIKLSLHTEANKIKLINFSGDFLSSNDFENIYKFFVGQEYILKNIKKIINGIDKFKDFFGKIKKDEILNLFFK